MANTSKQATSVEVSAAVIEHQNKVLITLRPRDKKLGGFWEFPGGKIEAGETQQSALVREIVEELDIKISVGALLETVHHQYDWGNVTIFAYRCSWEGGTIKHLEVADHRWVAPANLGDYDILAADQPIIKKLLAR
ncbi:MAG: (deoxy)nucleoside triphosphate pyrophosphohydrolase [Desulfuromonadales bacterium]|nr:(deoxy)nucleoside triphosphate pyrophosphohydrolase [Desulfuromonadales bacterium]